MGPRLRLLLLLQAPARAPRWMMVVVKVEKAGQVRPFAVAADAAAAAAAAAVAVVVAKEHSLVRLLVQPLVWLE